MKKIVFIFLSMIMLVSSCSNDEVAVSNSSSMSSTSKLIMNLESFNDSLMSSPEMATRSNQYSNAYSYARIAYKDIKGAYKLGKWGYRIGQWFGPEGATAGAVIGGIVGGAGYSYIEYQRGQTRATISTVSPQLVTKAYISVLESDATYSEFTPSRISINYPTSNANTTLMGAKHNLVLQKLVDNDLSLTPINQCLTPVEDSIISSKEFADVYYSGIEEESSSDNESEEVSDNVMRLYLQIFQTYPDRINDVEFITNKYIELIQASDELTSEEKEIIYSALSVAASSYEYWEENLK